MARSMLWASKSQRKYIFFTSLLSYLMSMSMGVLILDKLEIDRWPSLRCYWPLAGHTWYGIVLVVTKFWQSPHLANRLQNSSSARPYAGNKSKLRSWEKAVIWPSEGINVSAIVKFMALTCQIKCICRKMWDRVMKFWGQMRHTGRWFSVTPVSFNHRRIYLLCGNWIGIIMHFSN